MPRRWPSKRPGQGLRRSGRLPSHQGQGRGRQQRRRGHPQSRRKHRPVRLSLHPSLQPRRGHAGTTKTETSSTTCRRTSRTSTLTWQLFVTCAWSRMRTLPSGPRCTPWTSMRSESTPRARARRPRRRPHPATPRSLCRPSTPSSSGADSSSSRPSRRGSGPTAPSTQATPSPSAASSPTIWSCCGQAASAWMVLLVLVVLVVSRRGVSIRGQSVPWVLRCRPCWPPTAPFVTWSRPTVTPSNSSLSETPPPMRWPPGSGWYR
mmetsp:Transcript_32798/g.81239  ORF Transcript_32798/g.81239 Transcript_32798/m.81239 type:complete len:263 (+) Transcript_32798:257-1045(+)